MLELGASAATAPFLRRMPHGDGHPVLILPGFLAGDRSTVPLRHVLRGQGYAAHGWRQGRNVGPTVDTVDGLTERFREIHARYGQPISLIGWSLGGIYARRLALRWPDRVRQVITLGSPFRMQPGDRNTVSDTYRRINPDHSPQAPRPDVATPLAVPTTAIYTRSDGIVQWFHCIEQIGPGRENIEVRGSHSGLGFNPAATFAISDRLAQPADDWHAFSPPLALRQLYPAPADWRPDV